MKLHYDIDGEAYTVDVDRADDGYRITVGDRSYDVVTTSPEHGRLRLTIDGARHHVHVAVDGDTRYVAVGGSTYVLERIEERRKRRAAAQPPRGSLEAQMPGQIVAVLVDEGQTVEAGQPLVLMEAMKMELRVTAPTDGVVTAVHCRKGDVVERGQRLVDVESS